MNLLSRTTLDVIFCRNCKKRGSDAGWLPWNSLSFRRRMPRSVTSCGVVLLSFFLFSLLLFSAHAGDIKSAMLARLPEINSMKAAGVIGENNFGYLEIRSGGQAQAAIVNAENADRRTVYATIAAQQGTSVEMVGRRRARQISENAAPGTWLQNENGGWYQK